jgi:aryl-alcohol dehydrogenase-like predicted oxidoreductase
LASGLLTGKYNNGIPEGTRVTLEGFGWLKKHFESDETKQNIEKVKQLSSVSQEMDASVAQLALAWCLKNPNVSTVITGASHVEQVTENLKALDIAPRMNDDVMMRIEEILENKPESEEDFCE